MLTDTHWRIAREYAEGALADALAATHNLTEERVRTMLRSVRTAITRDNVSKRKYVPKTPDPREHLAAELIKKGVVYREIQEQTGLGYTVLKRIRRGLGLPHRKRGNRTARAIPHELRQRVKELWLAGKPSKEILYECRISWATLTYIKHIEKLPARYHKKEQI